MRILFMYLFNEKPTEKKLAFSFSSAQAILSHGSPGSTGSRARTDDVSFLSTEGR